MASAMSGRCRGLMVCVDGTGSRIHAGVNGVGHARGMRTMASAMSGGLMVGMDGTGGRINTGVSGVGYARGVRAMTSAMSRSGGGVVSLVAGKSIFRFVKEVRHDAGFVSFERGTSAIWRDIWTGLCLFWKNGNVMGACGQGGDGARMLYNL